MGDYDFEPVMVSIEINEVRNIVNMLEDARDNAHELLAEHDAGLGRTTKKNKTIAAMYEMQLENINNKLMYLNERLGV